MPVRRQSYPDDTPDTDEFLILTAKVIGGPVVKTPADMTDWVSANEFDLMEVVDDNSHYSAYDSICYSMDSKDVVIQVVLPFVISKDAVTFVLILPDDTHIPLDSIRQPTPLSQPADYLDIFYGKTARNRGNLLS